MKQHIILEKAYRYPEPEVVPMPIDCTFVDKKGYWTSNATGEIMMLSNNPNRPQSKKADIETGEDQKGE